MGRAAAKYAEGLLKLGLAAGLVVSDGPLPIGDAAALPLTLSGGINIGQGLFLSGRGLSQFMEALLEPGSNASWRNLLGLAPFGARFDDRCEPTPGEFLRNQYDRATKSTQEFLDTLGEISTLW